MADVCISQYSTKFPKTEPLDACYNTVVPTSTSKYDGIQQLKTVLNEKKHNTLAGECDLPLLLPSSSYYPLSSVNESKDGISLSERIKQLQARLLKQITSLQRSIHIHEQHLKNSMPGVQSLVEASQECPSLAACVLCDHSATQSTLNVVKAHNTVRCAGGKDCSEKALPFTRFCLKHINCDSSQVLYRSCQAIDKQSLTQCRDPVLDILSEEPVCHKHMSSQDVLKPPPKKKQHLSQVKVSKLSSGAQSKARRGATVKDKGAALKAVAKNPPPKQSTVPDVKQEPKQEITELSHDKKTPTINQPQPTTSTESGSKPPSRPQSSKSLDDLLTSSFNPPLPTLDLPPLKADIGEIMMAGEDSFSSDEGVGDAEP